MNIIEKIIELEKQLVNPNIRQSEDDLNLILADDFIEISSAGEYFNKKNTITALKIENNITYELSNFHGKLISPDILLLSYKAVKNQNVYSLRSSVWKYQNSLWQLVFHQGTPIKTEDK